MEKLRGADTVVYVGSMCDDYNTMLTRDWETLPRYAATGLERGILANRISYFFNWHGPSLSINTACSSNLVALDHAVYTVRSGRSKVAVAAGTSLILSPGQSSHSTIRTPLLQDAVEERDTGSIFEQQCTSLKATLVYFLPRVAVPCGMWPQTATHGVRV